MLHRMDTNTCLIPDCGRPAWTRGWCMTHYQRWQKHGDPLKLVRLPRAGRTCSVEGCGQLPYAKGMCKSHYAKAAYAADPSKAKARAKKRAELNPEKVRAEARARYHANPEPIKARAEAWRKEHPDRRLAVQRAWNKRNPGRKRNYQKKHRDANKDTLNAKQRARYAANADLYRARNKAWRDANPDKLRLWSRAHAQRLRRQRPAWADRDALLVMYETCPPGFHVDHVIPLKAQLREIDPETGHKFVASGLDAPGNLAHLPAAENIRKKNYWSPITLHGRAAVEAYIAQAV